MLCYKDKTFCSFYKECAFGLMCHRALTINVKEAAKRWWNSSLGEEAPISIFSDKPDCFVSTNIIQTK